MVFLTSVLHSVKLTKCLKKWNFFHHQDLITTLERFNYKKTDRQYYQCYEWTDEYYEWTDRYYEWTDECYEWTEEWTDEYYE